MSDVTLLSYANPSPFPPSFEGNPWAYGFGLFGDVVGASLALAMLLGYLFEDRRARAVCRRLSNRLLAPPELPPFSPLAIYRSSKICLLMFVVMRTMPDAAWMLLWGEVEDHTIRVLLAIDLTMDGLALIPLLGFAFCVAWGRQVIPQLLSRAPSVPVHGGPSWDIVLRNGRIVLMVLLIAALVTIGKASG